MREREEERERGLRLDGLKKKSSVGAAAEELKEIMKQRATTFGPSLFSSLFSFFLSFFQTFLREKLFHNDGDH